MRRKQCPTAPTNCTLCSRHGSMNCLVTPGLMRARSVAHRLLAAARLLLLVWWVRACGMPPPSTAHYFAVVPCCLLLLLGAGYSCSLQLLWCMLGACRSTTLLCGCAIHDRCSSCLPSQGLQCCIAHQTAEATPFTPHPSNACMPAGAQFLPSGVPMAPAPSGREGHWGFGVAGEEPVAWHCVSRGHTLRRQP